jgi:hypothetical protein
MVATLAAPVPTPASPKGKAPDTIRVRCQIPALQYWSNIHVVKGNVIEVEHLWMTLLRWRKLPALLKQGWRVRIVFGFIVGHRVQ